MPSAYPNRHERRFELVRRVLQKRLLRPVGILQPRGRLQQALIERVELRNFTGAARGLGKREAPPSDFSGHAGQLGDGGGDSAGKPGGNPGRKPRADKQDGDQHQVDDAD